MRIAGSNRRLRVKLILPALTEATSPYWRPIKYSLFPPVGLATLAAYLRPDDEAVIVDEPLVSGEKLVPAGNQLCMKTLQKLESGTI